LSLKNGIVVGDLVRLKDDENLGIGLGLIVEIRESSADVTDLFHERTVDVPYEFSPSTDLWDIDDIPEYLLYKPIYLVLWQSGDPATDSSYPVWMFSSELVLVSEARKS
jgi:hypothetical protein